MDAWERARQINNPGNLDEIVVCAGKPICALSGCDAVEAQSNGCTLCKHIVLHPDGSETEYFVKASDHG